MLFDTLDRFFDDLPLESVLFDEKSVIRGELRVDVEFGLRRLSDGVLIVLTFGVFLDGDSISPSTSPSSGLNGVVAGSGSVSGGNGTRTE